KTASRHSSSSIHISDNDDEQKMWIEVDDPDRGFSANVHGKIEFSADETDIASLSAGGTASFEEKRDGTIRRLELAERNGQLERRYFADRHEQAYDAASRAWFAALLPNLIRET